MREGKLWILHLLAGAVILVLLGLHMFIMHLDTILTSLGTGYIDPVSAESVFLRSKQVFFMVTYIVLLGAALYHGFYGLRNILFELSLTRTAEKVINVFLVASGIILFIYGAFSAVYVFI